MHTMPCWSSSTIRGRVNVETGTKRRTELLLRLLLHREASGVLADAFELYTNAYERSILLRDFYGKEASLFTVTAGSDEEKERSKKGLHELMEGLENDRRTSLL